MISDPVKVAFGKAMISNVKANLIGRVKFSIRIDKP